MVEASTTAASEKPIPSGSAFSGLHPVRAPSSATTQRATPRPVVRPRATASGGNSFGATSGLKPEIQVGAETVGSAAPCGGAKRIGATTWIGLPLRGARTITSGATRNRCETVIAACSNPWWSGSSLVAAQRDSAPVRSTSQRRTTNPSTPPPAAG